MIGLKDDLNQMDGGSQRMTSSRELSKSWSKETTTELLNSQLTDFHLIDSIRPHYLPLKARPLSELNFFNKAQEEQKRRKSFHVVNETIKQKALYKPQNVYLYYFKHNIRNSPVSELEAFCCDCYRLLIPDKVPSAHSYYDDTHDYQFVGITSKNIPGFKSNHSDPLLEKDTSIAFIENNSSYQKHLLVENIKLLTKCLDRNTIDSQSSYFSTITQFAKNQFNFYFNSNPTAVWLRSSLEAFLKPATNYSTINLEALIKSLADRKKFLQEKITSPIHAISDSKQLAIEQTDDQKKYEYELHLLDTTIQSAQTLFILLQQGNIEEFPIEAIKQLEEMDKIAKKNGYDLDNMDRNCTLCEKIFDQSFKIGVMDLINYRIVKGLAMGLSARYVFEEGDNHNRNMAKDGTLIDFDMSLWPILSKFKDILFIDRWLHGRLPNENSFVITANDIRNFPNLQDALSGFYYWPTKITYWTKSMIDTISAIYDAAENLFTRHDNEIFQKLAVHPVFIFHKFKTLLKYMLTTDKMYHALAELNIRKDLAIKNEKTDPKNLIDEITYHEASRIQQLRKVLINMPEFQEFLIHHGEYVFQALYDEFLSYKEKYSKKLQKHSYYGDFIESISLDAIKKEYNQLHKEALEEKRIREASLNNTPQQNL